MKVVSHISTMSEQCQQSLHMVKDIFGVARPTLPTVVVLDAACFDLRHAFYWPPRRANLENIVLSGISQPICHSVENRKNPLSHIDSACRKRTYDTLYNEESGTCETGNNTALVGIHSLGETFSSAPRYTRIQGYERMRKEYHLPYAR